MVRIARCRWNSTVSKQEGNSEAKIHELEKENMMLKQENERFLNMLGKYKNELKSENAGFFTGVISMMFVVCFCVLLAPK